MQILDAAEPIYRVFFLALYSLGLRLNEARMLRWSDVDFNTSAVRLKQKGGSCKSNILQIGMSEGSKK
ncbi:MAG: tyrosine-type recombinase/integrase [Candidatus Aminicenantes bacterium]|nr:tyrosine-type recombinase/integrase [Candidatus Aminicenantes bacterium]